MVHQERSIPPPFDEGTHMKHNKEKRAEQNNSRSPQRLERKGSTHSLTTPPTNTKKDQQTRLQGN